MPVASNTQPAAAAPMAQAPLPGPGITTPGGIHLAGFDPDRMVQTGLPSKFKGLLAAIFYLPRKMGDKVTGKKAGTWSLSAEIHVIPDDMGLATATVTLPDGRKLPTVREILRVDDLNQWVPSLDGGAPAGATLETYLGLHAGTLAINEADIDKCRGFYLFPGAQNSRPQTSNSTKWHQWCRALVDAKVPPAVFRGAVDIRTLTAMSPTGAGGIYGFWERIEFKFKGGGKPPDLGAGGQDQVNDTLVLTEFFGLQQLPGAAAGASVAVAAPMASMSPPAPAPVQAPAPAAVAAPTNTAAPAAAPGGDIGPEIEAFLVQALATQAAQAAAAGQAPGGLTAGAVMNDVYQHFQTTSQRGAAAIVKLNDTAWFLSGDRSYWTIPRKGMIAATEQDAARLSVD